MEEKRALSSEELDQISRLQFEEEQNSYYQERPRWHRIMAVVLLAILILGIVCFCYWEMVPQG